MVRRFPLLIVFCVTLTVWLTMIWFGSYFGPLLTFPINLRTSCVGTSVQNGDLIFRWFVLESPPNRFFEQVAIDVDHSARRFNDQPIWVDQEFRVSDPFGEKVFGVKVSGRFGSTIPGDDVGWSWVIGQIPLRLRTTVWKKIGFCWLVTHGTGFTSYYLAFPIWVALLPPCIVGLASAKRLIRIRRRLAFYRCTFCGYDLRSHTPGEKCPECGTLIPNSSVATNLSL